MNINNHKSKQNQYQST